VIAAEPGAAPDRGRITVSRDIIRERTQAGLQAARARGRKGGRPKSLTGKKTAMAQALYNDKNNTVDEVCKTLNISRATLYRCIKTEEYKLNKDLVR
jgi:DNA invertase Pin-like site-specific DNA recombinase